MINATAINESTEARDRYYLLCSKVVVALEYSLPHDELLAKAQAAEAEWAAKHREIFA